MVHFGFNWLDLFVFMEQPLVPKYISQLLTCLFNTYYIVRAFFLVPVVSQLNACIMLLVF